MAAPYAQVPHTQTGACSRASSTCTCACACACRKDVNEVLMPIVLHQHHPCACACRKDANEVLVLDGPAVLAACIRQARPLPIKGLFKPHSFWTQVGARSRRHCQAGMYVGAADMRNAVVCCGAWPRTAVVCCGVLQSCSSLLSALSAPQPTPFAIPTRAGL